MAFIIQEVGLVIFANVQVATNFIDPLNLCIHSSHITIALPNAIAVHSTF